MDGAENYEFASPLGPKRNIVYDVRNMPVAIQMRTGDTLFKYDGNGNRVQKYSPEGVVTYVTDTYEIRGMQNIALYLGNVRFAEFDGEKATYFLRDHINSASVSMDEDGTVSETAEYLPFGSPRNVNEITSTDYTFTDQEKDRSTGLFNYDARHYDPRAGRFISPDSILPDPYDPQQLNRYAYARNNPLRYTDPEGQSLVLAAIIGAISAYVLDAIFSPDIANAPTSKDTPLEKTPPLEHAKNMATGAAVGSSGEAVLAVSRVVIQRVTKLCKVNPDEPLPPNDFPEMAPGKGRGLGTKAPEQVEPGVKTLKGQYVDDLGNEQQWEAHYDEYGRLIERTDFNAGNPSQNIPDTHYHQKIYGPDSLNHGPIRQDHIEGPGPRSR